MPVSAHAKAKAKCTKPRAAGIDCMKRPAAKSRPEPLLAAPVRRDSAELSTVLRQPELHEHTVRVFFVIRKRADELKPRALVQVLCGAKGGVRAGFQAEQCITSLPGRLDDSIQYRFAGTPPPQLGRRSHRLDFSMVRRQGLQRAAGQKKIVVPGSPERDVWRLQLGQIQRKHMLGRAQRIHVGQVLAQQIVYRNAGEIVDFDVHGGVLIGRAAKTRLKPS